MRFKSPPLANGLQRCLGWSTELAAPEQATPLTFLLSILGPGTDAGMAGVVLAQFGNAKYGQGGAERLKREIEQLDERDRHGAPSRPPELLLRLFPTLAYNADLSRALRRATTICINTKRKKVTTDDLLLAMLMEDGPAKDSLVDLGADTTFMRDQMREFRHDDYDFDI
jgi:hypothetical protein